MIIRCELIQRSKAKIQSTREWRDDNKIPSSKEGRESLQVDQPRAAVVVISLKQRKEKFKPHLDPNVPLPIPITTNK